VSTCPFVAISVLGLLAFFSVSLPVSCLQVPSMDPTNLNLLTLSEEGLTLNLESEPETVVVLERCLIGRVLADREIQFAYFSERISRA